VYAVEDLKAFSEAVFDNNEDKEEEIVNAIDLHSCEKMEYVKEQITVMKDLIEDTKNKIDEVKTIYTDVRVRMAKVEENLIRYEFAVNAFLKNETSVSGSTSVKARVGVYTTVGVSTTVCITLDAMAITWGICSSVNAVVLAASTITLEAALAEMRANLEILRNNGEMAIKSVQELLENQEYMETYLDKEEQVLDSWVEALVTVERKIQKPDRLFFRTLPVLRERYLASLDSLGRVAQDYLDQKEL